MIPERELPPALSALRELALDLRWTWSHEADALWARVDAELWERTRNPWTILDYVPAERAAELAADADFVAHLDRLGGGAQRLPGGPAGSPAPRHRALRRRPISAWSSAWASALPLYAGGLGVLAGDFLKAASDLGVPVVGIGLLYQEGYFRQMIDADGWQQEAFPTTIRRACRSSRRRAGRRPGCRSRSNCPDARCNCASGRPSSGGAGSICWTATTR